MINVVIKTIKNMSQEEIAEHEKMQSEAPAPSPTPEEEIATLKAQLAALETILLGGEVDG